MSNHFQSNGRKRKREFHSFLVKVVLIQFCFYNWNSPLAPVKRAFSSFWSLFPAYWNVENGRSWITVPSLGHRIKSSSLSCKMLNTAIKLSRLPGFSYFVMEEWGWVKLFFTIICWLCKGGWGTNNFACSIESPFFQERRLYGEEAVLGRTLPVSVLKKKFLCEYSIVLTLFKDNSESACNGGCHDIAHFICHYKWL